jgi:curved DNA-binding protein CbpA
MARDPYELLGVARNATLREVRMAYRKAVLKRHPDAFAGEVREGERLFRELAAAYREILKRLPPGKDQPGRALTPAELATLEMAESLAGIRAAFHRSRRKPRQGASEGDRREGDQAVRAFSRAYRTILQRLFRRESSAPQTPQDPLLPE